jgi:hypothetical protein
MYCATILNIMRLNLRIHGVMPHSFKTISMVSGGGAMLGGIFFEISSFRNRPSLQMTGIYDIVREKPLCCPVHRRQEADSQRKCVSRG